MTEIKKRRCSLDADRRIQKDITLTGRNKDKDIHARILSIPVVLS